MSNERSIHELLASLCDETISPEEMQRLDRLICSDAAVRRLYVEYIDLHARLSCRFHHSSESAFALPSESAADGGWRTSDDNSSAAIPFPTIVVGDSPAFSQVSPFFVPMGSFAFSYLLAAVIVGVGMLIGWTYQVSISQQFVHNRSRTTTPPFDREIVFVGRITGMVDCRWADPKTGTVEYAYVPKGRKYSLASGLMEITYDSGARVIIEGPCDYTVESETGGYLTEGRVTALVEKKRAKKGERGETKHAAPNDQLAADRVPASLFSVRTPTALVTDLGTEFGVEVDKDGMTSSHVFRGKVEFAVFDHAGKTNPGITLLANESAQTARQSGSQAVVAHRRKATLASFVRSELFAMKVKEIGELPLRPFRRWQAVSEQLRKRKDLLAYYDFQRDPDHPRDEDGYELLQNRAATGSQYDGRVMGAIRMGMTRGRFLGKDSLKFTFPGDGVRINIPGEYTRLTMMAWISLDRNENPFGSVFMTDKWDRPDHFHWQFYGGGKDVIFSVPNVDQVPAKVPGEIDVTGWHLWTIVWNAGRATCYVDGRRLAEWKVTDTPTLKIGEATIGNWLPLGDFTPRPLFGRMDEFAIFDRALDDADVKQIFEAGERAGNRATRNAPDKAGNLADPSQYKMTTFANNFSGKAARSSAFRIESHLSSIHD